MAQIPYRNEYNFDNFRQCEMLYNNVYVHTVQCAIHSIWCFEWQRLQQQQQNGITFLGIIYLIQCNCWMLELETCKFTTTKIIQTQNAVNCIWYPTNSWDWINKSKIWRLFRVAIKKNSTFPICLCGTYFQLFPRNYKLQIERVKKSNAYVKFNLIA